MSQPRTRDEILAGIQRLEGSPAIGPGAEDREYRRATLEVLLDIRDLLGLGAMTPREVYDPQQFDQKEENAGKLPTRVK